jgi:hypothetical protein
MSNDSEKQAEIDALTAENRGLKDEVQPARQLLIDALMADSRGFFNREELEKLNIINLKILRRTFDSTVARDYEEFLEKRRQKRQDAAKLGTVGMYNQEKGEWEGGI